ncbi:Hypothetical predicted protein [Pelobates cultripes]|uniref:Uncharacterized protein n=1 Tax=Pelobates cultripes TaxID=61616 RepID=A0AAD1WUT1_PELCU|nr:Hypothetical predicted protein [Pelobates cultripes]
MFQEAHYINTHPQHIYTTAFAHTSRSHIYLDTSHSFSIRTSLHIAALYPMIHRKQFFCIMLYSLGNSSLHPLLSQWTTLCSSLFSEDLLFIILFINCISSLQMHMGMVLCTAAV